MFSGLLILHFGAMTETGQRDFFSAANAVRVFAGRRERFSVMETRFSLFPQMTGEGAELLENCLKVDCLMQGD